MDKQFITEQIINRLNLELENQMKIATMARADAINSEIKQEGKFDTRAIEAGYLASAQARRLQELKMELAHLEALKSSLPKSPITVALGCLIEMKTSHGCKKYFLTRSSGGQTVTFGKELITVISVESPLGRVALGLKEGDIFELENKKGKTEYEVISIY